MSNEERESLKEERLEERFLYERIKLNTGSGFELIYPPKEEEKEEEYEEMIQKANDMWDEFTTGKKKDPKMEEKKKSQPLIKTPVKDPTPESSIDESDSEEELLAEGIKARVVVVELPVQSPVKEVEEETTPLFRPSALGAKMHSRNN